MLNEHAWVHSYLFASLVYSKAIWPPSTPWPTCFVAKTIEIWSNSNDFDLADDSTRNGKARGNASGLRDSRDRSK